jgi:hypothetical protein
MVDESREQTRAIHALQRQSRSLEGLWAREQKEHVTKLHQNAQRLLEPLAVFNPYAQRLTFLDDRTRTRRDHLKYLALIDSIALLFQHQRPVRRSSRFGQEKLYIEVELSDIELANRLAHEALGRSLDELPPQTRLFLGLVRQMVQELCQSQGIERSEARFSRRELRLSSGWSYDQVRVHLQRLVELEYVLVHRGGRGQSFVYELLYDGQGQDGRPFVLGLLDVEALKQDGGAETTKKTLGGQKAGLGGGWGAHLGPIGPGLDPPWDPSSGPMTGGPEATFAKVGPKTADQARTQNVEPSAVRARRNGRTVKEARR